MRKTKTCPKCECKKLLRIEKVADARESGNSATTALLAMRFEGHSMMGNEKWRQVGELEAITCSACGYIEFYCTNASELEPDGKSISWL